MARKVEFEVLFLLWLVWLQSALGYVIQGRSLKEIWGKHVEVCGRDNRLLNPVELAAEVPAALGIQFGHDVIEQEDGLFSSGLYHPRDFGKLEGQNRRSLLAA